MVLGFSVLLHKYDNFIFHYIYCLQNLFFVLGSKMYINYFIKLLKLKNYGKEKLF